MQIPYKIFMTLLSILSSAIVWTILILLLSRSLAAIAKLPGKPCAKLSPDRLIVNGILLAIGLTPLLY